MCVCARACVRVSTRSNYPPSAGGDFGYVGQEDFGTLYSKENTVRSEECLPLTRPRLCENAQRETNAG